MTLQHFEDRLLKKLDHKVMFKKENLYIWTNVIVIDEIVVYENSDRSSREHNHSIWGGFLVW